MSKNLENSSTNPVLAYVLCGVLFSSYTILNEQLSFFNPLNSSSFTLNQCAATRTLKFVMTQ